MSDQLKQNGAFSQNQLNRNHNQFFHKTSPNPNWIKVKFSIYNQLKFTSAHAYRKHVQISFTWLLQRWRKLPELLTMQIVLRFDPACIKFHSNCQIKEWLTNWVKTTVLRLTVKHYASPIEMRFILYLLQLEPLRLINQQDWNGIYFSSGSWVT